VNVLIVARTRLGKAVCVGGMTEDGGRPIRLFPEHGQFLPPDCPLQVGELWDMHLTAIPIVYPPHVEDHIHRPLRLEGRVATMRTFILNRQESWVGGPSSLFDGRLRFAHTGRAFVSRAPPLPRQSVGYWVIPDPLSVDLDEREHAIYRGAVHDDSKERALVVPYVGTADPARELPAGTLVRVSLSRWWRAAQHVEERCYLQMSGWYDHW
jgi:hypothetical protein